MFMPLTRLNTCHLFRDRQGIRTAGLAGNMGSSNNIYQAFTSRLHWRSCVGRCSLCHAVQPRLPGEVQAHYVIGYSLH